MSNANNAHRAPQLPQFDCQDVASDQRAGCLRLDTDKINIDLEIARIA
jgi:hypothetical protein